MSILSERIDYLCQKKGITGYRLCKDINISPNIMTELRKGRRDGIGAKNANKIADYFGVSVGYLLGAEEKEKPDPQNGVELSKGEDELIQLFRLLPEELKAGILAQIEAVLKQRGLLPERK